MRSRLSPAAVVAVSLTGCAIVLVCTARSGLSLATVSGDYFAATRSLLAGNGFIQHDASPYLYYPPLFPLLLAFFGLFGADPAEVVRPLNAVVFGATVFAVGWWLRRNVRYLPLVIYAICMIAFGMPLLLAYLIASSEPVLLLLTICSLFALQRYLERDRRGMFYLSAVLAMLATMTRYTGAALVPVGVLLTLLRPGTSMRRRIGDATVFSLITVIPLLAWFTRNYLLYSVLSTERGDSVVPIAENARLVASFVSTWLSTGVAPGKWAALPAGLLLVGFIAFLWRRYKRDGATFWRDTHARLSPLLLFALTYAALMVVVVSTIALDNLGNRYLIPMYIPLVLGLVVLADEVRSWPRRQTQKRLLTYGIAAVFLLVSVNSLRITVKNVKHYAATGLGGYAAAKWRNSEVIEFLKATPLDGELYSNETAAIYVLARVHARLSPRKTYFHSTTTTPDDVPEMRKLIGESDHVYLAWFDTVTKPFLVDIDELKRTFLLEPIARYADGVVYRVRAPDRRG